MFPVLFKVASISVSSFGVFLALGSLLGIFLVWRLARAWDLEEEKTLDLTLLTFVGGLLGARVYFIIEHLNLFTASPLSLILINRNPGFSFWGGFLGGWLTLFFFAKRFKVDFWQLADIASVGLMGGLILSDLGCFLGACNIGIPSTAFFSVTMVGSLGKRLPIQIIEALFLSFGLLKVWSKALHFHQRGKIVSLAFIYIGISRLVLEPLKQDHSSGIFSAILLLLGLTIFYKITKQSPITHLKSLGQFFIRIITDSRERKQVVQTAGKGWYNTKASIAWKLRNFKKMLRRFNVKFS
ncbi:prolipoprotein diacylglyceryl transferase [Patescibacteria group bacterium]|nr:prolipoprotein diacylglyceryl transferase [Patescibacteria group bacterium]